MKFTAKKYADGWVATPTGKVHGVVVGQGRTKAEALADVKSAYKFHLEAFPESVIAVAVCDKKQGLKCIYSIHDSVKIASLFHHSEKTTLEYVEIRKISKPKGGL